MTAAENVVLVTVDSLRADRVLDESSPRTPVIDGLAEDGTVFERAFAPGNWTPFSFPGILASRPVFAESGDIDLPSSPTLAEFLGERGFSTAGFNAANGFLTGHWGYDRGFDEFESFITGSGFGRYNRYLAAHPTVQGWWHLAASPFRRAKAHLKRESLDRPFADVSRLTDVEENAKAFVREADGRFFLWVHYMDAHTPYVPAPRHLREVSEGSLSVLRMLLAHARTGLGREVGERTLRELETLYDATIRQIDASVGRLLEAIGDAGLADDTCVVVAGDHGEEFMEHGHLSHYPKLYGELVHVPLIVSGPTAGEERVSGHVGLEDVPPTIGELVGETPPSSWEGTSIAPAVRGEALPERDPTVSVTVRGASVTSQPIPRRLADGELLASARTDRWTYILHTESGDRELYDRSTDPGEREDLLAGEAADRSDGEGDESPAGEADVPAGVVGRLDERIQEHVSRLGGESSEREHDRPPEEVSEQLESLGYL